MTAGRATVDRLAKAAAPWKNRPRTARASRPYQPSLTHYQFLARRLKTPLVFPKQRILLALVRVFLECAGYYKKCMVASLLRKIIGEERFGNLLYFYYRYRPEFTRNPFAHFNGQTYRQRIFEELLKNVGFDVLVETGTYFGNTTAYFAATGLPVYSVEINPIFHRHAARTFSGRSNQVHLFQDDSPGFLRMLANDQSLSMTKPFFYLDAHWYNHLPLAQELEIIYGKWKSAVALVDDFQVPGTAYAYDDYGPDNALTVDYLKAVQHLRLSAFFPAAGPELETGFKRGCIVLAQDESVIKTLREISFLTPGAK